MLLLPWFGTVCGLLVVAGVAKFRSPASARSALGAVGVTVPRASIRLLGATEVIVGGWAAFRPSALTGGAVAALYGSFTAFVIVSRQGGEAAPCGCFGAADTELGPVHAALNAVACGIAIAAAIAPPQGIGSILDTAPLTAVALTVGIGAAAFGAYLAFTAFPHAWRAYGAGER